MYALDLEKIDRRVSAEIPARAVAMVNGAKTPDGEPLQMLTHEGERKAYWERLIADPPKPADPAELALRQALGLE